MKILVYGAGNIGSLYAAKLMDAGHDVTILARGARLHDIREHGIVLQDFRTGRESTTQIKVVEKLAAEDAHDLMLVILPRSSVPEILPILASNQNTPSVMFLGNNAAGPDEMIDSLGRERVVLGFPGAAGVPHDEAIRYVILDRREQATTIGELDGSESSRIKAIASALQSAGFPISICSNMDAWLKTHVAEIVPTAGALYMAECNIGQLKRNRKTLVTMIRAIREGHRVLSALGIPITPSSHKIFRWIPEFLMVLTIRRKLDDDAWNIKIGHAAAARDEMKAIADEFRELARQSGIATPAIDQLRPYLGEANQCTDDISEPHIKATCHPAHEDGKAR
jgi:2-dehydropantoate 2-reductase